MTAAEATALSHDDPGWRLVATGETIPYEAAYLPIVDEIPAGIEDEVRQRAAAVHAMDGPRGAASRQRQGAVVREVAAGAMDGQHPF